MLQRLARFMYRRRRWVLGGWIVLLVAHVRARRAASNGAFKTEFKLPGTESQAAFDLLEKSSFRNRQVQAQIVFAPTRASTTRQVQQAMEGLFDEIEQKIPDVEVASPYAEEGARQIVAQREDRVRARSTSPTAPARSSPPTARRSRSSPPTSTCPGSAIEFGGDMFADPPRSAARARRSVSSRR